MILIAAVIIFSLCISSETRAMQNEACLITMPDENVLAQWFDEDKLQIFLKTTNFIKMIAAKTVGPEDIIECVQTCLEEYLKFLQSQHNPEGINDITISNTAWLLVGKISKLLTDHPQAQKEFDNMAYTYWPTW